MKKEKVDIHLVEQEYSFDRKEDKWRRAFYCLFGAFLLAGALGAFGNGALSNKTLKGEGFLIRYERFLRTDTPSKLEVNLSNIDPPLTVSLGKEYLEKIEVERVVPQPESVEAKENGLVYSFKVDKGGTITFYIKPQSAGPRELEIEVQGQKKSLDQFVYF